MAPDCNAYSAGQDKKQQTVAVVASASAVESAMAVAAAGGIGQKADRVILARLCGSGDLPISALCGHHGLPPVSPASAEVVPPVSLWEYFSFLLPLLFGQPAGAL